MCGGDTPALRTYLPCRQRQGPRGPGGCRRPPDKAPAAASTPTGPLISRPQPAAHCLGEEGKGRGRPRSRGARPPPGRPPPPAFQASREEAGPCLSARPAPPEDEEEKRCILLERERKCAGSGAKRTLGSTFQGKAEAEKTPGRPPACASFSRPFSPQHRLHPPAIGRGSGGGHPGVGEPSGVGSASVPARRGVEGSKARPRQLAEQPGGRPTGEEGSGQGDGVRQGTGKISRRLGGRQPGPCWGRRASRTW